MKKLSKRQINIKKLVNNSSYPIDNAIKLLKQTATTKFNETAEFHVNLNIDPKYADQQLRTTITLPHGTGQNIKIAVLTNDDQIEEAKKNGADIAGNTSLINEISEGNLNFDLLIATSDMMPKLAKLGRILGPKGLMPSPKSGTVSTNLIETLLEFKKGKFEYKTDKTGIVHVSFGKLNFSELELKENLITLYKSIEKNKPAGVKGKYFKNVFVCTTMGPSILLDLNSFE